jgi:hypothetical protein
MLLHSASVILLDAICSGPEGLLAIDKMMVLRLDRFWYHSLAVFSCHVLYAPFAFQKMKC